MSYANIGCLQYGSYSASASQGTEGAKTIYVQGFASGSPTYDFTLTIGGHDGASAQTVNYYFQGIRNNRRVNVAHLTPAINTEATFPMTALGEVGVQVAPGSNATCRLIDSC